MIILLLVFMGEIKIDLPLKKSNFRFLLCFKIAIIKFIPMRQQSRQRNNFLSSRVTSNLMLPACLMGMILVVTAVCNSKNLLKFLHAKQISRNRTKKNACGGLWRPDIACNNNVVGAFSDVINAAMTCKHA